MEVLLEKTTPTDALLKIKLVREDYQPKIDKTLKEYSKKMQLKGFRPGKVPTQVVQKMYGKGILMDEINALLSSTVSDYIRDNKLPVVGDPLIDRQKTAEINWNNKEFDFEYQLGLASDFEVNLGALPAVSVYDIVADTKELDETIENVRTQSRFAEQTHPEISEAGDMLFGELTQESSEFSTKTAIPFKQIKDEFQAQFIGLTKDSIVTFDIQNTFEDESAVALLTGLKKEDAANLAGEFAFKIEDITRSDKPEMNQAFFDKVLGAGKAETEEAFREQVLDIVKGNYARESQSLLNRDLEQTLLDNIQIDLPKEFLMKWLFEQNEGKFTMEQIEADYDKFAKSLKLSLIKNKIADQNEVKVEYDEIIARTEVMVREQFGMYASAMGDQMDETIKRIALNYLADKEKGSEIYSQMFSLVFDDKVLEILKTQIASESKTIDVEQFKEIVGSLSN
ncbi:MAG: trigger factor [Runella slithyformis]|jgi:trigger factor|nr:MAG: trigger factor [Runella slithyformis]